MGKGAQYERITGFYTSHVASILRGLVREYHATEPNICPIHIKLPDPNHVVPRQNLDKIALYQVF